MAEGVTIEYPIGIGPTDSNGKGSLQQRESDEFWVNHLAATGSMSIATPESFAAGYESVRVLSLKTKFPNGIKTSEYTARFTYTVDDDVKIKALARVLTDERSPERPAAMTTAPLDPKPIPAVGFGFWSSKVLLSAVGLGAFTVLAKASRTRDALGLGGLESDGSCQ
jgi:hypothetical protein